MPHHYKVGTHGARTVINMPSNTAGQRYSRQVWKDDRVVFTPVKEAITNED